MIKFDITKLKTTNMLAVSVTTALGGSITYIDGPATEKKGSRVTHRKQVPFAVARAFIKSYHQSRFLVPVMVAVTEYDGVVVSLEKQLLNRNLDESGNWVSTSDYVIRRVLPEVVSQGNWYIDGVSIYSVHENWMQSELFQPLTSDGRFYAVTVQAIKLQNMAIKSLMERSGTKSCVAFKHKSCTVLSPPIWSNVLDIRGSNKKTDNNTHETQTYRFDALNSLFFVNLEFVLSSANKIGSIFGYEHTEFLELDRHMITFNTVNLPKIPKSQRSTYNTQKTFLVCMAWVFGYLNRCDNLNDYCSIRGVIKNLCNKGLFDHRSSEILSVNEPPQAVTADQALLDVYSKWGDLSISSYFMNKGDSSSFVHISPEDIASVLSGVVD